MINKLPIVDGYTMDSRLNEFRKVEFNSKSGEPSVDFIPFNSKKGQELLEKAEEAEWEGFNP